jgi:hypothetical protein
MYILKKEDFIQRDYYFKESVITKEYGDNRAVCCYKVVRVLEIVSDFRKQ